MANIWQFFTNTSPEQEDSALVEAQAFSLTKVIGLLAPVVAAAGTWAASQLKSVTFTSGEVTAIIIAVLAVWAITSVADVLARSMATSAEKQANGRLHMITFDEPVDATAIRDGADEAVEVVAVSDAKPAEYLVLHANNTVTWESAPSVHL
ncbi:hypothetical protein [Humibacillus xanthopallidus]|uniref:Uncharacterized protein n=1 Tax=Humibacillus xanthopallidus TaxID=412689 RepID=A0A543HTS4_9MICO|nr:hypothetical protein [Humibacillus xanthopallidus]TQM61718.1 hypothetical protein FBY41_1730 [Humibacillus xanthopallidus]